MIKNNIIVLVVITSIILTLLSVNYERFNSTVVGNLCEKTSKNPNGFCYEKLPAGGFPFSWLYDAGGVSVMGKLSIGEDEFYTFGFILNIIFYFLLQLGFILGLKKLNKNTLSNF